MKERRGDERLLSFYWFLMFIIITVAVVSAVVIFTSRPFDIRSVEAQILADKLVGCIAQQGNIAQVFEGGREALLEKQCALFLSDTSYTDAGQQAEQYYVQAKVGEQKFEAGNMRLPTLCDAAPSTRNIPACTHKRFVAFNSAGKLVNVDIDVAVRKMEKNGKT